MFYKVEEMTMKGLQVMLHSTINSFISPTSTALKSHEHFDSGLCSSGASEISSGLDTLIALREMHVPPKLLRLSVLLKTVR